MEQDGNHVGTKALVVINDHSNSDISLEEQVLKIEDLYHQIKSRDKTLMAMKTRVWCKLGKILIEHRINVLNAGYTWDLWAVDHFPYIKERRRQQCMKIGEYSEKTLEHFYHLGFDRLYNIITKLQPYMKDADYKYLIGDKYRYVFRSIQQDNEDKNNFNKKIDIITEYFKFKMNIASKDFNRDVVIEALEAGVDFKKPDCEYLKQSNLSDDKFDLYIRMMILTASSPTSNLSQSKSKSSVYVILTQLLESLRNYDNTNNYPAYLSILGVDNVDELIILMIKYRNTVFGEKDF